MAEAISKGNEAINKLVFSGEIEELRDVVGPPDNADEAEEYLQDDGEIDYSKVPDIDLPPPLPSSKFAQNPELLKTLNRGGKRKFDQLIGWSDGGASDRTSKIHQPVFGGVITEDSQSSDTDLRFIGKSNALSAESNSFHGGQDEDHHRRHHGGSDLASGRGSRGDEDLRFNLGPGRSGGSHGDYDLRNNFADKDFRFPKKLLDASDPYDERDRDTGRWDDEKTAGNDGPSRKSVDGAFGGNGFDKRDLGGPGMHHMAGVGMSHGMPNHHNMQNINPNMPPPLSSLVPHPNMGQHPSLQGKPPHPGMPGMPDGPPMPPHMMHHPNMHPGFGPNGPPPPGSFGPNFRPPPNGNFGPNHFRPSPMPPFGPNQGPPPFGNGFQGPPSFRGPNAGPPMNFDRPGGFGPNFRGQTPQGQLNSFNSNYGNYGGKNGPNRGLSRGGGGDNMGRSGYGNRGRGRDNDQSRGARGRDNY